MLMMMLTAVLAHDGHAHGLVDGLLSGAALPALVLAAAVVAVGVVAARSRQPRTRGRR